MHTVLLIAALSATTLRADTIPINNHSFEQPELGTEGQQTLPDVPGWKASGRTGVFANTATHGKELVGVDRSQMAYLNGARAGELAQDVLPSLRPNTIYTLSASVALREDSPLAKGSSLLLRLQAYDTHSGKLIRTLGLKAITVGKDSLSDARLTDFTATFISETKAPDGGLRISIAVGEKDGGKGHWTIDNVRLEARPKPGGR